MTKTTRASNCVWLFLRKTININPFYVRPLLVYLEIKGQHSRRCHKDVTNLRMDIMYNMCSMINLSETFLSISMSVSKDFLFCPKYRLTLNHCQISCYYSCGRIEQWNSSDWFILLKFIIFKLFQSQYWGTRKNFKFEKSNFEDSFSAVKFIESCYKFWTLCCEFWHIWSLLCTVNYTT